MNLIATPTDRFGCKLDSRLGLNVGSFNNLQAYVYWSGTDSETIFGRADLEPKPSPLI